MVYWQKFDPEQFEYEFDENELAGHDVTVDEAAEVLWNGFDVDRNKDIGAVTSLSDERTVGGN